MSCRAAEWNFSAFIDGNLDPATSRLVASHLESCGTCRAHVASLRQAIEALADLPRIAAPEPIAQRVRERLEVERRGPGLALLFRSRGAARPLILPSLLPAALTVLVVLAASVFVSRDPRDTLPEVTTRAEPAPIREPLQGTEGNPFFPSSQVALPRLRAGEVVPVQALANMGEGSLFLETVVARDGSVSTVTLLEGDSVQAKPLLEALRHARFEPVRVKGRPVAVSVYRLISLMEVLAAPRT
jgi:anti-sigma factor RsiW